ncbi:MAG: cell division protein FtsX [Boseongicola sp.]
MNFFWDLVRGDISAEKVVPRTGLTAFLTTASAAAMAFLAIFVLSLAVTTDRQAERWEDALADTATVRISAPAETIDALTETVEAILTQTPGVGATRRLSANEQAEILAPWFGPDLPLDSLRLPVLIEVDIDGSGPDTVGLGQRFAAEAPGAVYDDHGRWREPMVRAAQSLRRLALTALLLIAAVTAVTISLAASASLAANGQVIDVLRLVGAEDSYITRAFVRRFTLRALVGGFAGTLLGLIAVALVPNVANSSVGTDVGFDGFEWLWPILVPLAAGGLAFTATRLSAARRLKEVS